MTEGAHRRRTTRRGRLPDVPLDDFKAALLGAFIAAFQECAGVDDVRRTGYGNVSATVRVKGGEVEFVDVSVSHTTVREPAT